MFSTLYSIAGGIALTIGAMGASEDFDGAQLAQNAFFNPEEESETLVEEEMATEDIQVVKDINEWNENADKVMSISLTGKEELTDDEKLEFAVLTGELPSESSENLEEVSQVAENSQPEGLSEEEFYCMLEKQYCDAIEALNSKDEIDGNLIPEENQEELANVQLQPEDDVSAEKALEEAVANSEVKTEDIDQSEKDIQVLEVSEEVLKEEPWVVIHGLPDIPEMDYADLTDQETDQQPAKSEQTDNNVTPDDIPILDIDDDIISDVEAPEVEDFDFSQFEETEEADQTEAEEIKAEEVEAEETEAEETEAEETEAEEVEAEEVEAEETEAEEVEAEEVEAEEVEAEETEAEETEAEETEAEETEAEEVDDLIVEPLEADDVETDSDNGALIIPSIEIPPAVVSEQERAKISAEVDALVDQNDNFDSWIPRQIPVSGSVDDVQTAPKPEEIFIQEFSKQNVKESILENTGIDLNE